MCTPQETLKTIRANRSRSEAYKTLVRRDIYTLYKTQADKEMGFATFYEFTLRQLGLGRDHTDDLIRTSRAEEEIFPFLDEDARVAVEAKHLKALAGILDITNDAEQAAKIFRLARALSSRGNPSLTQVWSAARDEGVAMSQ